MSLCLCVCVCVYVYTYVDLRINTKGFVENRHNLLFVMMNILIKYCGKTYRYIIVILKQSLRDLKGKEFKNFRLFSSAVMTPPYLMSLLCCIEGHFLQRLPHLLQGFNGASEMLLFPLWTVGHSPD